MMAVDSQAAAESGSRFADSLRGDFLRAARVVLASVVVVALTITWAIALVLPRWWLLGLFTFTVGATTLWGAIDRHVGDLRARGNAARSMSLILFTILRVVVAALAVIAMASLALFGLGMMVGSLGPGG